MSRRRIVQNRSVALAILWPILAVGCDSASTGANANANKRTRREVPPPSSQALQASEAERQAAERALKRAQEQPPFARPESASAPAAAPETPSMPAGHPPLAAGAPTSTAPAAAGKMLKFDPPADWNAQPPSNRTRLAEYDLSGDAAKGTTTAVLTAFPPVGQMADLETNLKRWMSSFMTADGEKLSRDAVEISEKSANDLKVTVVKMSGRYLAPASMGGNGKITDDVQRMVMLMVPTPEKVYFLRIQGPEAAVKAAEEKLDPVIGSFKVE